MKISTKGRYALRLMTDLAIHKDEGYISIKTVSQRQNISEKEVHINYETSELYRMKQFDRKIKKSETNVHSFRILYK